jgi:hypothetical protein
MFATMIAKDLLLILIVILFAMTTFHVEGGKQQLG